MVNTKIWKYTTPPWEKDPQGATPLVHPSKVNSGKKETTKSWRKNAVSAGEEM